jgi:serine protease
VDNGARVLNISISGTSQSTTLLNALQYAVGRGAFIAVSMGNRFEDGNAAGYPAAYAPSLNGLMSVGATAKTLAKAFYSSTGTHAEIAAPGGDSRVGVGTTDQGRIWQSTLLFGDISPFLTIPRFDRYDKDGYQGTSMASPHVAGLAALLLSQVPSLTPAQLESIISSTARDIGLVGRDDAFGHGLIQPRTALFGRGILR